MKIKLFWFLALLVTITGCDKIKEAATVTIPTHFKTDIPVTITSLGIVSAGFNAATDPVLFSVTQDLNIADNVDVAPYLAKIKKINLNEIVITVTGLTAGQTINSVSLDIAGIGNIITKTNITMTNNTFTPVIQASLFDQVAAKLMAERKITCTVYGSVSGPMTFNVGLSIDADVVAYLLK